MQLSPLNSNMLEMAMVLQLKTTEEPLTTLTAEPFDSDLFICGVFLHHLQGWSYIPTQHLAAGGFALSAASKTKKKKNKNKFPVQAQKHQN